MYENLLETLKKHGIIVQVVVVSFVVSAIVGAVFGYYGATLIDYYGRNLVNTIVKNNQQAFPRDESSAVVDIVKKYSPAVVSIVETKNLPVVEQTSPFQDFCSDPFFRQFFDCSQQTPPQQRTQRQEVSAGSGFIVRSDGIVVTNKHVASDPAADYTVITSSGTKYSAKVLARDPVQDLAVLKIDATGLSTVVLGDSDSLEIGQTVIAIGNALGQFSNSVSKGVVSGLGRSITASSGNTSERLEKIIQTDAAINPGNSGGPLINLQGQVIGIDTAIVSGAQNVGFAIPINSVKRAIVQVQTSGKITYAYLGVRYNAVNEDIQKKYNLSVNYGALVIRGQSAGDAAVIPGSPAAKAGIKENDVILEVDGKKIDDSYTLAQAIQSKNVGDTITLKVLRDKKEIIIPVLLEVKSS